MTPRRKPTVAVTLLEVLLSLAIMGMIGVAIGNLFQTGGQVWQRVEVNQYVSDHAIARSELRRDMEQMPLASPTSPLESIFQSNEMGFSFVANLPTENGTPIWSALQLQEATLMVDSNQTLRADIARMHITYFGRKTVRELAEWHDDWRDATILPRLIKIETWTTEGLANPPLAIQPGKITRQSEISLSSLVPPD